MPICKKCNDQFPNRVKLDGKEYYLNSRSYCLNCSPHRKKAGYELRKESTKKHEGKSCLICEKPFQWQKNSVCSTCRNWYRRYIVKTKCIEYKGGVCLDCNASDHDILSFHHRVPNEKLFVISHNLHCKKWEELKVELDKCDLLCNNCHIKTHKQLESQKAKKILDYYEDIKEVT